MFKKTRRSSVVFLDTPFIYDLVELLRREGHREAWLDYRILVQTVQGILLNNSLAPAREIVANVEIRVGSAIQAKFVAKLQEMDLIVEVLDYKATYISRRPSARSRKSIPTSSPLIAFNIGRLLQDPVNLCAVSGSYDLHEPLVRYARLTGSRVLLCYFSKALDARWSGVLNLGESPIEFISLDQYFDKLILGVTGGIESLTSLLEEQFSAY